MEGRETLRDVAVILAVSFPVLFLCRRLKVPQVVGFLLTGVVAGPHALAWVHDTERIGGIAEFGVVLILFFVGLHYPLERLVKMGRIALVGGSLQVLLTTAALFAAARVLGAPVGWAAFIGLVLFSSSTAVVLPILAGRDEIASPLGRAFLGVSLFQDLAVIPAALLLPALAAASPGGPPRSAVLSKVGLALAGIALLVAAARRVVPRLLDAIVRLGSRESFTGGVVFLVMVLVALAEGAGVSAALGAFAAGIVLGESEHVHEVAATLAPFRDLLSSLFFVSIGMLFDPGFVAANLFLVASALAIVPLVKGVAAFAALRAARVGPRTALRAGLALATVGEFSFVVLRAGEKLGLSGPEGGQIFVAVAVVTMAAAPLLVALGEALAPRLAERVDAGEEGSEGGEAPPSGHIVVVGYGLNGRSVSRVLKETGIPHLVVEIDPERVSLARRDGVRVIRAEATGAEAMEAAGVAKARGVVVTIADADGARRITHLSRQRNADARILVRTRYIAEVEALREAGADEVIPEEFETSIEIVSRVLRLLHVPGNLVAAQIRLLRDEGYRKLRDPQARRVDGRRLSALLAGGTTELFLVLPDTTADGRALDELNLALDHVVVPALLRDGSPFAPVPAEMTVQAGDTLLLAGAHEDLARAIARLERTATVPHAAPAES